MTWAEDIGWSGGTRRRRVSLCGGGNINSEKTIAILAT